MKVGWRRVAIGEIAEVKGGKRVPKGSKLQDEQTAHPYISVADFTDSGSVSTENMRYLSSDVFRLIKNYTISADDLYISIAGTIGKCGIIPPSLDGANLTENACKLVFRPGICKEFVYYFTQSESFISQALSSTRTAAQPKLALERLKGIRLDVPPLPEQQRIVAILDEAFAAIATAKANAEKNLQNARAVFERHLESTFSTGGKGWRESSVSELAEHSLGKMLDKVKNRGTMKPYLRNINVRWFTFDLSDLLEMPFLESETSRYSVRKGDVVICEGGYPGRAAIWMADEPIHFQKALHRVRFTEAEHRSWFLYYIYSQERSGALRRHFTGTGIQHFTGEALAKLQVPVPPKSDVQRLVATFESLQSETLRLESIYRRKLAALDELKKSLLHRAFNGDL